MRLSIRATLTVWYSTVVVAVLVTGAVVGSYAQSQLVLQHLDDDLLRSMATLQGVMRTEFSEGMSLEDSAKEASVEVVVPDRTMVLTRADGAILEVWGLPMDRASLPPFEWSDEAETVTVRGADLRVLSSPVEFGGHRYNAAVIATMAPLNAQNAEMRWAMFAGIVIALIVAAAGGWLIGRQTLRPLTQMAEQAREINEQDPRERLAAPPVDDELGRLATAFNGLLDRLASALNHQRQFMADASHELRTPVSVVRTATQVTLARDVRPADEYRESLVIIGEQANRLSRLVDSMFLLSRAEAHGVPLRREFLNLDDVLLESARAVRVLAEQRGVTVTTDGEEEVSFTGDDALLRQMMGNLLDNAVRHARSNGRVTAELEQVDGRVVIRITDDGAGVAPSDQARIFERFVRVGTSDGAGLGLPIARWIAEAHGGTLQLAGSRPGCTMFVVNLPADSTPA